MPSLIQHPNYKVLLYQEVPFGGTSLSVSPCWWTSPVATSSDGTAIVALPSRNGGVAGCLFDSSATIESALSVFAEVVVAEDTSLLQGGLGVLDLDDGSFLRINWDIGETEEWREILDGLRRGQNVTHTFSATDVALDASVEAGALRLQLLDWEALPNRLETSRMREPVHVFPHVAFFLAGVDLLVEWASQVEAAARCLGEIGEGIAQLVSVNARRRRA